MGNFKLDDRGIRAHVDLSGGWPLQREYLILMEQGQAFTRLWVPGEDGGRWVTVDNATPVAPEPDVRIALPAGAWAAIVQLAVPHADAGEVGALREALEVERRRVDELLALIARPTMVMTEPS